MTPGLHVRCLCGIAGTGRSEQTRLEQEGNSMGNGGNTRATCSRAEFPKQTWLCLLTSMLSARLPSALARDTNIDQNMEVLQALERPRLCQER